MADSEADDRAAVVAAARSWLGTPYHNCADIRGVGVDCGMLLVRVFVELGLPAVRPAAVSGRLASAPRARSAISASSSIAAARSYSPQPGDVMVLRYGRCYSHGGIVTNASPLTIVHAYHPARSVIEEEIARNAVAIRCGAQTALLQLLGEATGDRTVSIFRTGAKQAAVTPDYTGLQIQTAVNALPVPIVWGESKLAPNVIWYNNFQTHAEQSGRRRRQRWHFRRRRRRPVTPIPPR